MRRALVAGASGMIGTALVSALRVRGVEVRRLVRQAATAADEISWDPARRMLPDGALDGVDAVVNLSGASVGRIPWTAAWKRELVESRIATTETLAQAIRSSASPPAVFLNASAIGYYGHRPGETLTEDSRAGTGFFPDLVLEWEARTTDLPASVRTVLARTGVVFARGQGAIVPLERITRVGLAGRLGRGTQRWSWISLDDEVRALEHVLLDSALAGPVNLTAPQPATSLEITRGIARQLRRPHLFVVPEFAIRLLLGEAGERLLLDDAAVVPSRLMGDGFAWNDTDLTATLAAIFPRD